MPASRLAVHFVAAACLLAVVGSDVALAADGPVLGPGHEAKLLSVLRPADGEVPAGWALLAVRVPRTHVEAVYGPSAIGEAVSCSAAPGCVQLRHPDAAPAGAPRAGPFAIVGGGTETPAGLMAGVRARLEARRFATSPWVGQAPAEPPEEPAVTVAPDEASFRALLASDADVVARVLAVEVREDRVRYRFRTDEGPELGLELTARAASLSNPADTTSSFHLRFEGGVVSPADLPSRVHAAVRAADDGSLRLAAPSTFVSHERTGLHRVLWWLAVLLGMGLLVVAWPVAREVREVLRGERLAWGLLIVGMVLRLVLPARLTEFGIGYMLTDYADALIMPRYGASVPALHHALFALFGVDHAVMLRAHAVIGALSLPIACAAGARLLAGVRESLPGFVPALAGLLALTPMLARIDPTESNLVPALAAVWIGLLAWLAPAERMGRWRVVGAIVGFGWAALARPELVLVAPAVWVILGRPWRTGWRSWGPVAAAFAVLLPWQVAHVVARTAWEVEGQALGFGSDFFDHHLWVHLGETALWEPRLVPVVTPLLALYALVKLPGHRRMLATLLIGGLAWIAVYAVDLSSASAPRLHTAGLQAWSLCAAAGLAHLASRRRALVGALALWLATAAFTVPWLWGPTNEDTEEQLIREVRASMSAEPGLAEARLAVLQAGDAAEPDAHVTHRYFPRYLFDQDQVIALGAVSGALDRGRVLYFQGVNCHAVLDRDERGGAGPVTACAEMHERYELEPLWVQDVPNRGNPRFQELGYYGPEPSLRVGLWEVKGLLR